MEHVRRVVKDVEADILVSPTYVLHYPFLVMSFVLRVVWGVLKVGVVSTMQRARSCMSWRLARTLRGTVEGRRWQGDERLGEVGDIGLYDVRGNKAV